MSPVIDWLTGAWYLHIYKASKPRWWWS